MNVQVFQPNAHLSVPKPLRHSKDTLLVTIPKPTESQSLGRHLIPSIQLKFGLPTTYLSQNGVRTPGKAALELLVN